MTKVESQMSKELPMTKAEGRGRTVVIRASVFVRHLIFGIRHWVALVACLSSLPLARSAHAQAAWEFSPYQVQVWLALEDRPELGPQFTRQVRDVVVDRAEVRMGAVWRLDAAVAPRAIAAQVLANPARVVADTILATEPKALENDKLYLVGVQFRSGEYLVTACEIDGRTRQSGPVLERVAGQREAIPLVAWDLILDSLHSLTTIETVSVNAEWKTAEQGTHSVRDLVTYL